ncbi:MAG: hypothetical protein WCL38_00775 [Actinomycetota bacterium]
MKKRTAKPDAREQKYDRATAWSGLRAGDPIDVDGVPGRGITFTFLAYVTNRATNETWVEAVGGRDGRRDVRSFRPEQIFPRGALKRKGAGLSLAEQPGLPLI